MDNSAYLQFMWKADVVESWIADKETHVRSEEFGRDLSTVQTLLTKQETFDAGNFSYFKLVNSSVCDGVLIKHTYFVYKDCTPSSTKEYRILQL